MKLKLFLFFIIISCNKTTNEDSKIENSNNIENHSENTSNVENVSENEDENNDYSNDDNFENNKIEDGSHSASVDYFNPKTGYSATYDLDVDVEDGKVVRINFPKGGWLDDDVNPSESQLIPAELNEDGEATMEDENGRTFEIKINDL